MSTEDFLDLMKVHENLYLHCNGFSITPEQFVDAIKVIVKVLMKCKKIYFLDYIERSSQATCEIPYEILVDTIFPEEVWYFRFYRQERRLRKGE